MTAGITLSKLLQKGRAKKGAKLKPATKRAKKKAAPAGPIVLTAAQDAFLEQITQEGMARMRWSRAYAERKARQFLSKANTRSALRSPCSRTEPSPTTPCSSAKPPARSPSRSSTPRGGGSSPFCRRPPWGRIRTQDCRRPVSRGQWWWSATDRKGPGITLDFGHYVAEI